MRKETLNIEFAREQELEVYDRFERKVNELWNKLQQIQIKRSSKLQSRNDVEKLIVIKAFNSFLSPLPGKERLERRTREKFSDFLFDVLVEIDREYPGDKLKEMCLNRGLPIGNRDKKELAWELLKAGGFEKE